MDLGKSLVALTLVLGLATPAAAQITTYTPNPITGGGTFYTPGPNLPLTGLGIPGGAQPYSAAPSPFTYYTPNPTTGGGTFYTPQFQPLVRPYGR
jgi:hypothetical protein